VSGPSIFIATNGIGGETERADTCCQSGADLGLPGTALVPRPEPTTASCAAVARSAR
jgi:hypothetical protein